MIDVRPPHVLPADAVGSDRMRVVVICGGPGPEHSVSLSSGRAIGGALRRRGHRVTVCRVSRRGEWQTAGRHGLRAAIGALLSADLAVPALHGPWGEDGSVQGFLETVGVPYLGSGVLASATCMDKARTKAVLAAAGVPVAPGRVVTPPLSAADLAALVAAFGLPLFVKPLCGGSSYGVSRVASERDLGPALAVAAGYDASVLVEPEIRGREIDVGILERADGSRVVAPLLEIPHDVPEGFFSTAAKYDRGAPGFLVPAPLDVALADDLVGLARRAFDALGCSDLARIDFLVDDLRGPLVNEVNTMPGFTEHSQVPLMWRAAGIGFDELVESIVKVAANRASTARSA